jgi:FkbM family methyltransferase
MKNRPLPETGGVRLLRGMFGWWPFERGRGWLLRLCGLLLGPGPLRFDIGAGVLIEGVLRDWVVRWTFMRLHERDEPFQRSLALVHGALVIVDVGANLGVWSLLAARRNSGAQIHAFEPAPRMAEQLRCHIALNGTTGIQVHACAVGAEEATMPFFVVPQGNTGASSFFRQPGVELRVPVTTVDDFVHREGIERIDMLKVDAEGAEILVLKGACEVLSSDRAPAIFFELSEQLCARCGVTGSDVKQLLVDHGYAIYRWRRSSFVPVEVGETHEHEDLFAIKRLRSDSQAPAAHIAPDERPATPHDGGGSR